MASRLALVDPPYGKLVCASVLPGHSFSSVVHESTMLLLSKAAKDTHHPLHTCSGVDMCLVDKQRITWWTNRE